MADGRCFNPRPRTEGDAFTGGLACGTARFQSTPSHGGRPRMMIFSQGSILVSIHALARRATAARIPVFSGFSVSIHALARRATANGVLLFLLNNSFNPRPRTEGDIIIKQKNLPVKFQSTPSHGGRLLAYNLSY